MQCVEIRRMKWYWIIMENMVKYKAMGHVRINGKKEAAWFNEERTAVSESERAGLDAENGGIGGGVFLSLGDLLHLLR